MIEEYTEYKDQLKDIRWFRLRDKVLQRDHNKCTKCHSTVNLNVHHLYYVYGRKAWDYPQSAFTTLCKVCHEKWHDKHEIVVRDTIADKKYKPIKRKKVKIIKIKGLENYNIPTKDLKLISTLLSQLSYKDRYNYIGILRVTYKSKKIKQV